MCDRIFSHNLARVVGLIAVLILVALLLGGCAVYKGSREAEGVKVEALVISVGRKAEDVKLKTSGGLELEIGKIGSAVNSTEALCILFPHLCSPEGD